ncbi:hypothetical protein FACS1894190_09700 [Spirochaetia bacterium]|nr:hypothetical protein FACS1894190_09700 [Spirochaetia bacterium]GHV19249.1 hypothetical protein FACS189494_00330 [Spirochaetia bacterium]
MLFSLRPLDFGVFIIAAAVMVAAAFFVYGHSQENIVINCLEDTWVFPPDESREVKITGPLGETTVKIENGRALVTVSPCENKLCLAMPSINKGGQWIACLPNRVIVTVESTQAAKKTKGEEIDASTW